MSSMAPSSVSCFARQFEKSLDTARETIAPTRDERKSVRESMCNPLTPRSRLLLAAYRVANHELAGKAGVKGRGAAATRPRLNPRAMKRIVRRGSSLCQPGAACGSKRKCRSASGRSESRHKNRKVHHGIKISFVGNVPLGTHQSLDGKLRQRAERA